MYLSADETRLKAFTILADKKTICPTDLCMKLFKHLAIKVEEKRNKGETLDQLGLVKYFGNKHTIEWTITCQAIDELLLQGTCILNRNGTISINETYL